MFTNRYTNYDEIQPLSNNELLLSMTNAGPSGSSLTQTKELKKEIKEEVESDEDNDNMPLRTDEEETEYYNIKEEYDQTDFSVSVQDYESHPEQFNNLQLKPTTESAKFVYVKRPNGSMKPVHGPIAIRFNNAPDKLEVLNPQLATALKSLPGLQNVTPVEDPSTSTQSGYMIHGGNSYGYDPAAFGLSVTSNIVGTVRSQRVEVDGQIRDVPEEIPCKCGFHMRICLRKSRYKDEKRTYAAYRCLKKGCQTFRAVSKILNPMPALPSHRKRKPAADAIVHKVPRLQQAHPIFKVSHPQGTASARYTVDDIPHTMIEASNDVKEEVE